MLYRIYTEDKNRAKIEKIIAGFFKGFTILKAKGFWRLQKENSLIIEVEAPRVDKKTINKLAQAIKKANTQEAVMVQELQNHNWFV